ncbi:MAG TPA: DNA gyrase subunit A [Candidatus Bathyarchaeia archaeon]|nr:DNA gyrase subunit A [Candidatus Bathyarchaeia archaeon]
MGQIGKIIPAEITREMKKSYLDYAMSVIVSRALPDVRDGLKPVHRRILFAMKEMGLTHKSKFAKSAKIVGETMGKYHPHGDGPIYQALVRLAQDFSMRYPLVIGQGNFGSIDDDPPAAMRYTEAKMAKISDELLSDLDKETVEFRDNFDGSLKEPVWLPAKIPNLLLMGSDGIAVGMATKIPPHNLVEVIDALHFMIKKGRVIVSAGEEKFEIEKIDLLSGKKNLRPPRPPAFETEAVTEDLIKFIKGPDFPTGGLIYDQEEITRTYTTGKGRILTRGKTSIEETNKDRLDIIISEIPYQVNKAILITKIASLIKDKKIKGIADLRDESDRRGLRIVLELKKIAKPKVIINKLYKHTQLQITYPANIVALVNGVPRLLTLRQILMEFIHHRQQVITKRTFFDLRAAKKRAHILEGLKIALDNLDEVIETIKKSRDADAARLNLMKKFSLTEIQAEAILEMQLRRLAALERKKIEDEYEEVKKLIDRLTTLLVHPEKILEVIFQELEEIKKTYGDERKTLVFPQKIENFSEEDLVPAEECLITITKTGYIKRLPVNTYRSQRRGGKGVTGMTTKEADEIAHFLTCNTHDLILFFTNHGRVFTLPAWEIAEGIRQAKGHAIINLINIDQGELIQTVLPLTKNSQKKYIFTATHKGIVKKTPIDSFAHIRSSGLIAIKLRENDQLCWAKATSGQDYILLVSYDGKSIRFKESDARPMGRDTMGVKGIRLKKNDYVVSMETFSAEAKKPKDRRRKYFRDILTVSERGLGKRTPLSQYPIQKRGGVGVKVANITDKTGKVVLAQLVTQHSRQLILTSKKAQVIKLPVKNIPRLGRDTQGVILMRFSKAEDTVAAATCL